MSSTQNINKTKTIFILSATTAFGPLATDTYLSSIPTIAESLNSGVGEVQLSLSSFFIGLAVGQFIYGPLSDSYGRRKPLLIGIAIFALASLLEVFAPTVETFVGFRFIQAIGGCSGMIITRAIIRDLFNERESAQALSLLMIIQGIAPIVAPVLGAYIVSITTWRAIFAFLVVFSILCFTMIAVSLPETLPAHKRRKQNLKRVLKTFFALSRRRAFIIPTIVSGFAISSLFAFISGSSFVFISLYGVSQQHFGWLFGLNAVGIAITGQLNRILLRHFAPKTIFAGMIMLNVFASTVLLSVTDTHSVYIFLIAIFFSLWTIPLIGANSTAIAMAASGRFAGSASSVMGILQFSVAGLVSSLVGVLHDGTAYPMTSLMFLCSLMAVLILIVSKIIPNKADTNRY